MKSGVYGGGKPGAGRDDEAAAERKTAADDGAVTERKAAADDGPVTERRRLICSLRAIRNIIDKL